jgi:polyisoprenoid-binding protein YceI
MTTGPSVASAGSPRSLLLAGKAAGVWELDPAESTLEFRVKHFWGLVTVRGRFTTLKGRLAADATGNVTGPIEADSASLTSGNSQRDKHLRSADFFDVANHPTVVFNVDGVEPGGDDILQVTGTLTAAGRSLAVTFDARLSDATHEHVAVDGEVTVDRRDSFGMTWSPLGMAAGTALLVVHAVFAKSPGAGTN